MHENWALHAAIIAAVCILFVVLNSAARQRASRSYRPLERGDIGWLAEESYKRLCNPIGAAQVAANALAAPARLIAIGSVDDRATPKLNAALHARKYEAVRFWLSWVGASIAQNAIYQPHESEVGAETVMDVAQLMGFERRSAENTIPALAAALRVGNCDAAMKLIASTFAMEN